MDYKTLTEELNKRQNGSFISLSWKKKLPVYKAYEGEYTVEKVVKATIRKGINPQHTALGRAKFEAMTPEQKEAKHPLPWGVWIAGYEGILLRHKEKTYLRVFFSPNHAKVSYFINGEPISKNDLFAMPFLTAAGRKSFNSDEDFFNITIDNIISIG